MGMILLFSHRHLGLNKEFKVIDNEIIEKNIICIWLQTHAQKIPSIIVIFSAIDHVSL